jgi:Asp-tRNA(Asn)/Glu-tRNA(Gln) amidotransferase C subunit
MAKRKSFEEKNKHIHKSRKLIIDTVFGREDNTQRVFGYEKEAEKKREVGEVWTDSEGKTWEQKEGFKISVSKMDDVREYLKKLTTCHSENCETTTYAYADKKMISRTGYCVVCMRKLEQTLREDGTWPFYEDYKITLNKLAFVREEKQRMEEALGGIKDHFETVTEDGRLEKWNWQVDIEKVKTDLKNDINGAYDAIEALIERKLALENKLQELKHPELVK